MSLKKLYYSLEDKWYNFAEKSGLYKLTDKIDKVLPSFVLFILLIVIIIAGILLLVFSGGQGGTNYNQVYFMVIDGDTGDSLPGVPILISTEENNFNEISSDDGSTDNVGIPRNTEFYVDIDYTDGGYDSFSQSYFSESDGQTYTLPLIPLETTEDLITYDIKFANNQGTQILENGTISFMCATTEGIAPSSVNIINGEATVQADPTCQLIGTVYVEGYNTKYSAPINQGSTIYLEEQTGSFQGADHTLTMYTKTTTGDAISNIKIIAKNDIGLIISECITNTGGTCALTGLATGHYTVNLVDNKSVPIYNTVIKEYLVETSSSKNVVMTTDIQGYIKIKVIDEGTNEALADSYVVLKSVDQLIFENYTDANGEFLFTVSDLSIPYRVVADVEGYLIESKAIVPSSTIPTTPTIIELDLVTPSTLALLKVKVVDEDGRGYKFAKVALYDSETGFLTDYQPKLTNYDGNVSFSVSSGNYYAVAVKGSSIGQSSDFYFDVRQATTYDPVIVPMAISKGNLKVNVVNKDGEIVPNARIDIYDRYSYLNFNPPKVLKSDLTNVTGEYEVELDADSEYYVVVSDPINNTYGTTQSRFVRVLPTVTKDLEVTLYREHSALSKPQLLFKGLFKEESEVTGNLKANGEYEARFTLLVPQDRSGDQRIEELGAIIRTGSTVYLENDSLYIKYIDVPFAQSITKYTQFNMTSPHEVDGIPDTETSTEGDAKWAMVVLDEADDGYYNAYEIAATIKVKDIAAFGEELKLHYLGFVDTDDGYETYNVYTGTENDIEYYDVYSVQTYGIGDEVFCNNNFCYSMNLIDEIDDLRYDVTSNFAAQPNKIYKLHFMLINNQENKKYIDSRLIIENLDEGLEFNNIRISQPNGDIYNINPPQGEYEFDYTISSLAAKQKVEGDIEFTTELTGDRHIVIKLISDQQVQFVNDLIIDVSSDKTFKVEVTPNVIPAGKTFNLQIDVTDMDTGVEVEDSYIVVKDRFLDNLVSPLEVGVLGEVSINNIPAQNADDKIFVYVTAPEYETYIKEIRVTDRLFSITPKKLAYTLNIHNEKSKVETFIINNISELDLEVEEMELIGEHLEIIDLDRINNELIGYSGLVINGLDSSSDFPNNEDASKNIEVNVRVNPRAEGITKVQNLSAKLRISLKSDIGNSPIWIHEIPVNITVGFDGMIDNPACLTLSENVWEEVALDKPVENQFTINNTCTMNEKIVPLMGGLEAKIEFESNPLGKVILNVDNRVIELSHGYYKNILDSFDRDKGFPVIIKYEPQGRMKGNIKGKVIFRSVNQTSSGEQELKAEYNFDIDVLSLSDCVVFTKDVLTLYRTPDTFSIENKACGTPTTYRLSCDDCRGLEIEPMLGIDVDETGASREINVTSFDAVPGMYQINVYSKLKDSRQSERNVGKIKVIVRPLNSCIDLDRYEYDLYRAEVSENTGIAANAKSYDTGNLINTCYQQEISGIAKVKNSSKLGMAFLAGFRDSVFTGLGSGIISGKLFDLFKSKDTKVLESQTKLDFVNKEINRLGAKETLSKPEQRELNALEKEQNKLKLDLAKYGTTPENNSSSGDNLKTSEEDVEKKSDNKTDQIKNVMDTSGRQLSFEEIGIELNKSHELKMKLNTEFTDTTKDYLFTELQADYKEINDNIKDASYDFDGEKEKLLIKISDNYNEMNEYYSNKVMFNDRETSFDTVTPLLADLQSLKLELNNELNDSSLDSLFTECQLGYNEIGNSINDVDYEFVSKKEELVGKLENNNTKFNNHIVDIINGYIDDADNITSDFYNCYNELLINDITDVCAIYTSDRDDIINVYDSLSEIYNVMKNADIDTYNERKDIYPDLENLSNETSTLEALYN